MNHHEGHSHESHETGAAKQSVKDPVCGMNVDPASALRHEHAGQTYYFCSEHCRGKFQADPGKYAQSN